MNFQFETIIIGAGPAGLFTALNSKISDKTLILEKNQSAGKKLLMSGAGRCNLTQFGNIRDFFSHYGDNHRFLIPALNEFTNYDLMNFFNNHGLKTINIKSKIFPETENSEDVLDILLHECMKKKVKINYDESVKSIELINDGFAISANNYDYISKNLVIATGGKSYPTSGSNGDGYQFAKATGHTVIKPKPALTPVYISNYKFKEISGISLGERKITVMRDNLKIKIHQGDIGFTHWGLSGPGILDLSRFIEANDVLKINLINQNPEIFREMLNETAITDGKRTIKRFLKNFTIPENLIKLLLDQMNLETSVAISSISKIIRNRLVEIFCEYPFHVQRTGDFNIAMVTAGGISLKEVNPKTMESKLVKNLYFVGEVLDIDGDTGGFNLQAAFSTAFLAAKNLS
ncbi:MAG: NAD(P)/FAD-dependent oxidoreductase [Candidatus Kapabacteria bacterium]|nr:NAD(P)/FAD-dependent oxidoreductase [Candidatus Kapabacteria bacterium]